MALTCRAENGSKHFRVGLTRHAETERLRPGASPGTALLLSLLESALGTRFTLRLLPARFYSAGTSRAVLVAESVLSDVDALVLPLPAHPAELEALFLVRRRLGRRIPFIYLPLGEFPRGAWCYRHIYRYLGPQDLICFSSTADQQVYRRLVETSPPRDCVVPFGIDRSEFCRARLDRAATRQALGVAEGDRVLVVHGRIDPEKNIPLVVDLFTELAEHDPRLRLWLV